MEVSAALRTVNVIVKRGAEGRGSGNTDFSNDASIKIEHSGIEQVIVDIAKINQSEGIRNPEFSQTTSIVSGVALSADTISLLGEKVRGALGIFGHIIKAFCSNIDRGSPCR
ncbi:hypothetical protein J6590_005124 [Homalodisca vitripennis]|nr:hypothetical protein J6590_005124 [Homalodisca vitripennis]